MAFIISRNIIDSTQIQNPVAAQYLRRMCQVAIQTNGVFVDIYPLVKANYDNLYNDRIEKGVTYRTPDHKKVAIEFSGKELTKFLALYLEKDLPLIMYMPAGSNYEPGSKVVFPFNPIDTANFATTWKITNRTEIGTSPYVICMMFSITPQRF